jgi:hypothetical protein
MTILVVPGDRRETRDPCLSLSEGGSGMGPGSARLRRLSGTTRGEVDGAWLHGHLTVGGMDDRIEATLPPVFRPKMVPRS